MKMPVNATLIIKDDLSDPDPEVGATSCKYGNSDYDTTKYVLASDITTNGCAVDLNLYQSETAQAPAKKMITNDEDKIKNEFKTLNLNVTDIYLNSTLTPIINLTGNGIVGYGIEITQSIINSKGEKEVITKYQLKTDGSRIYSINKYNLK
jgi:hypothetical protein